MSMTFYNHCSLHPFTCRWNRLTLFLLWNVKSDHVLNFQNSRRQKVLICDDDVGAEGEMSFYKPSLGFNFFPPC